jgi:hypothetical protein
MGDLLVDALLFALGSAIFGGFILLLEIFIRTLIDPCRIDPSKS